MLFYQSACAESRAHYAMKREIASGRVVTSVEYVRRSGGWENRFRERCTKVYIVGTGNGPDVDIRFVFRVGSDTHGTVVESFLTVPMGGATA